MTLAEGDVLIRGERMRTEEVKEESYYRAEVSYGAFERRIPVPKEITEKDIEATYDKGVLEVVIRGAAAIAAPAGAKQIPVQTQKVKARGQEAGGKEKAGPSGPRSWDARAAGHRLLLAAPAPLVRPQGRVMARAGTAGRGCGRDEADRARDGLAGASGLVGLPRGRVRVAAQVARTLDAPLDVLVVRKLGCPLQPELAMGVCGDDALSAVLARGHCLALLDLMPDDRHLGHVLDLLLAVSA